MIYNVEYIGFSGGTVVELCVKAESEQDAVVIANKAKAIKYPRLRTVKVYISESKIWEEDDFDGIEGLDDLDKAIVYWKSGEQQVFNSNESAQECFDRMDIYCDFGQGCLLKNNQLMGVIYGSGVRVDVNDAKWRLGLK